ncbi:MAG: hypothetical protein MZV63_19455 [Marinilabiliales bacterium]|nr:hypothetical protein [Marinilabiliales bacterium]
MQRDVPEASRQRLLEAARLDRRRRSRRGAGGSVAGLSGGFPVAGFQPPSGRAGGFATDSGEVCCWRGSGTEGATDDEGSRRASSGCRRKPWR